MDVSCELNENIYQAVANYSDSIIKIAFTYIKNIADAEDIAQEVFLTYLKKAPVFENKTHEKAWLIRVTINKSKDFLKSRRYESNGPLPEDLAYLPPEDNEVMKAVLSLDRKYRIPIHLFYYEGYTIGEIAALLKAKPSTVGSWLARGRSILKNMIGGFEDGQQPI